MVAATGGCQLVASSLRAFPPHSARPKGEQAPRRHHPVESHAECPQSGEEVKVERAIGDSSHTGVLSLTPFVVLGLTPSAQRHP
jgi:hypothetical protein